MALRRVWLTDPNEARLLAFRARAAGVGCEQAIAKGGAAWWTETVTVLSLTGNADRLERLLRHHDPLMAADAFSAPASPDQEIGRLWSRRSSKPGPK